MSIRQATESNADAMAVGELLSDAFPETFQHVFGRRDATCARAIGFALRGFGSMRNAWLIDLSGAPAGVVLMRWANRETPLNGLRALVAMARVLGVWRTLWTALHIPPLPPRWLHDGEAYISVLAVAPDRRGHGHGTALLDYAVALAAARGYSRVSLRVDEANQGAQRLFERSGFRPEQREWDWVFNLIRRHFGEVLMSRPVEQAATRPMAADPARGPAEQRGRAVLGGEK